MLYLITGRRELGKTTLAYALARTRSPSARVIFDPRDSIGLPGASRVDDIDAIGDRIDGLAATPGEVVIVSPSAVRPMFVETCECIRDWIVERPRRKLAVIFDEVRLVGSLETIDAFDFVLRCSTKSAVSIFVTCHRPTDVPVDLRAIVDYWMIFQTTQPHDLATVARQCGGYVASAARVLEPYHWIEWDEGRHAAKWRRPLIVRDGDQADGAAVPSTAQSVDVMDKQPLF